MKAAQIASYGDISVVFVTPDASDPPLKSGQVIVEVRAVSLNPFDAFVRAGAMQKMLPLPFPITVGGDFAGVVRETGEEVYGSANVANGGSGSFAQIAAANRVNIASKPKKATFEEAAALPLVGASAVQGVEEHIKLAKGQKILIHGGAGGIGHLAIQLAKAMGAWVATTVSTDGKEFVKSLGADLIIDYKTEKFEEIIHDYDAMFDMVGGDVTSKSFAVLKKGGILVSMVGQPDQALAQSHEVTAIGQGTKTDTKHLDRVTELVDGGKIVVHIDKIFTLEQVKEAWEHQKSGHPRGKVVVQMQSS